MRYELGLAGVSRDGRAAQPLGMCRDDLLAHLVEQIADELSLDDYELRELLSSELPLSSDDGTQQGDLLVMMRADNVGGPLSRAEADRVIDRVDAVGRGGVVAPSVARFLPAERTIIVPPWALAGPLRFGEHHPLHGAWKLSVVELIPVVDTVDAADRGAFRELLELSRDERLPISVWR